MSRRTDTDINQRKNTLVSQRHLGPMPLCTKLEFKEIPTIVTLGAPQGASEDALITVH